MPKPSGKNGSGWPSARPTLSGSTRRWSRSCRNPPAGGCPDITRSACGRLAGEIALLPTAFGCATWAQGGDADTATATLAFDDDAETAELRVERSGRLAEVRVSRWGNPGGAPFARYPFGVQVEAESDFNGITIPSMLRAGWWWGTDRQPEGEFFRAQITSAVFR